MDDILGRVAAILAAAIIFMGIPITYMQERAKSAEQMYLLSLDTKFVDTVCSVGFLDMDMYQQFLKEVASAPGTHEVKILHEQKEIVLSKETYSFESTYYDEEDIFAKLQQGKVYTFGKGDFIKVMIIKEKGTFSLPWITDETMNIFYGGTVRYASF